MWIDLCDGVQWCLGRYHDAGSLNVALARAVRRVHLKPTIYERWTEAQFLDFMRAHNALTPHHPLWDGPVCADCGVAAPGYTRGTDKQCLDCYMRRFDKPV